MQISITSGCDAGAAMTGRVTWQMFWFVLALLALLALLMLSASGSCPISQAARCWPCTYFAPATNFLCS